MTTTTAQVRPTFEYEYRWERIIPAAAALIIGVAVLVWGIWSIFSGSASEPEPVAATTQQIVLPPPVASTAAPEVAHTESVPPAAASIQPAAPTPTITQAPAPAVTNRPAAPVAAAAPRVTAPAPVVEAKPAATVSDAKTSLDAPAPAALKPGQISVVGGASHVQLQQVLDQEPLDLKKGSISIGQEKAVKVVFSAEINKPGETVHYRWYHNGKLVAKVRTKVSPEGTTRGSKFISYDTPGEWQVQMLNKNGKLLAETAFSAKTR